MKRWPLAFGMLLAAGALLQAQGGGRQAGFPHPLHDRLFPTCEGCHIGIISGDAAAVLPDEARCRACHNGNDMGPVAWRRPAPSTGVGFLRFAHTAHAEFVDSAGRECATCHNVQRRSRMDVSRASPEACLACHTHQASSHLAEDNRCAGCHVALASARGLSRERIGRFPQPPSHARDGFATAHSPPTRAASATCATCHARESCARCHVNAARVPVIAALGRDDRVSAIVAEKHPTVSYPTPADHRVEAFAWRHGASARERVDRCGACHARQSCTTCHTGSGASEVLRDMPVPDRGGAQGVQLLLTPVRFRPPGPPLMSRSQGVGEPTLAAARQVRVHDPGFRTGHSAASTSGALTCAGCHAQRFCSDCHAGEGARRYHAANFAARHAADAYGRDTDCATCHSTEAFCRACHQQSGLSSGGKLNQAYHTAQPLWLIQHGRAARQGLQNCASCHAQRDCLTCHATTGWGINPHGAGFDAARAAAKAPASCLFCHLEIPRRR